MGLVKGIDAISKLVDKSSGKDDGSPKQRWFKLDDGQSAKVRFLQEFDENSASYNSDNGSVLVAIEHSAPKEFRTKALCTADEGKCFGCEMNRKDNALPKEERSNTWYGKTSLYANVLVTPADGADPYVAILRQGIGPKSITPTLIEISNEYGGITENEFRIKRNGGGFNNTSYSLVVLPNKPDDDVSKYELYDLQEICTRNVPYEEQPKFFGVEGSEEDNDSSEDTTDIAW
jgi:hypothetical protein